MHSVHINVHEQVLISQQLIFSWNWWRTGWLRAVLMQIFSSCIHRFAVCVMCSTSRPPANPIQTHKLFIVSSSYIVSPAHVLSRVAPHLRTEKWQKRNKLQFWNPTCFSTSVWKTVRNDTSNLWPLYARWISPQRVWLFFPIKTAQQPSPHKNTNSPHT